MVITHSGSEDADTPSDIVIAMKPKAKEHREEDTAESGAKHQHQHSSKTERNL